MFLFSRLHNSTNYYFFYEKAGYRCNWDIENISMVKNDHCYSTFSIYQKIPSTTFWFAPLEIFRNKRNFWKGNPVSPVKTWNLPNGNLCFIYKFLVFITSPKPFPVFLISCFASTKMAGQSSYTSVHNELYEGKKVFQKENCWLPKWLSLWDSSRGLNLPT